jgi:hypothetical protein
MAFNNNTPRLEFTATSGQTEFVFNFKVFNTSDIVVYQTPTGQTPDDATDILIETTHYTVAIDGDNGGTVTLVSGATLNDSVTLLRDLPFTRETDYQTGGDLLESTLDEDQDYQTYLSQQLESSKGQFINLPASVQGVSASIPSPIADSYFKWNAAGDGIENDITIPTNVALAVDSAAAALVSENAAAADLVLTNADVVTTGNNVTAAQLLEWEAEAERLTANSYATEAEDVFVNTYSSDGDGTFTATPTTEYSALHWAAKASVGTVAIDISITDVGGYYTGTEAETALQEVGADLALKANLASPALTGTPTAPTATIGTNTTQLATTAFVLANSSSIQVASTAEAQAGTDNTKVITPLRLREGLNASGTAPIYACRAWVNFNGTGTVAIRASGNVSSVGDSGVGDYTVNFTTAMPDANYGVTGTAQNALNTNSFFNSFVGIMPTIAPTVSAIRLRATSTVDSATAAIEVSIADPSIISIAIFR